MVNIGATDGKYGRALMTTFIKARSYLRRNPGEAMTDLVGLAAICALVIAGFSIPSVF